MAGRSTIRTMLINDYAKESLTGDAARRIPASEDILDTMEMMQISELRWVGDKNLSNADSTRDRLFIPTQSARLVRAHYLSPAEVVELEREGSEGIAVNVIGDDGVALDMNFRYWKSIASHGLTGGNGWRVLVQNNQLSKNMAVEIFAFKSGDHLGFTVGRKGDQQPFDDDM